MCVHPDMKKTCNIKHRDHSEMEYVAHERSIKSVHENTFFNNLNCLNYLNVFEYFTLLTLI